jgi:phasin family protein
MSGNANTAKASVGASDPISQASSNLGREKLEEIVGQTKSELDSAKKGVAEVIEFQQNTLKAVVKSAAFAAKGIQAINSEVVSYAQKSAEDTMAATRAIMATKSFKDIVDLQAEFSRDVLTGLTDHCAKLTDLITGASKEVAEPFQRHYEAAVKGAQNLVKRD